MEDVEKRVEERIAIKNSNSKRNLLKRSTL